MISAVYTYFYGPQVQDSEEAKLAPDVQLQHRIERMIADLNRKDKEKGEALTYLIEHCAQKIELCQIIQTKVDGLKNGKSKLESENKDLSEESTKQDKALTKTSVVLKVFAWVGGIVTVGVPLVIVTNPIALTVAGVAAGLATIFANSVDSKLSIKHQTLSETEEKELTTNLDLLDATDRAAYQTATELLAQFNAKGQKEQEEDVAFLMKEFKDITTKLTSTVLEMNRLEIRKFNINDENSNFKTEIEQKSFVQIIKDAAPELLNTLQNNKVLKSVQQAVDLLKKPSTPTLAVAA